MRLVRAALILAALAAALVPIPPRLVESHYSKGIYPALQSRITPLTNLSPIALVDLAVLAIVILFTVAFARRLRARGLAAAVLSGAVNMITLTAFIVLWFFVLWGVNYRRVPLDEKIAYDKHRITREAAVRLGNYALREVNSRYAAAHGGVERRAFHLRRRSAPRSRRSAPLASPCPARPSDRSSSSTFVPRRSTA